MCVTVSSSRLKWQRSTPANYLRPVQHLPTPYVRLRRQRLDRELHVADALHDFAAAARSAAAPAPQSPAVERRAGWALAPQRPAVDRRAVWSRRPLLNYAAASIRRGRCGARITDQRREASPIAVRNGPAASEGMRFPHGHHDLP